MVNKYAVICELILESYSNMQEKNSEGSSVLIQDKSGRRCSWQGRTVLWLSLVLPRRCDGARSDGGIAELASKFSFVTYKWHHDWLIIYACPPVSSFNRWFLWRKLLDWLYIKWCDSEGLQELYAQTPLELWFAWKGWWFHSVSLDGPQWQHKWRRIYLAPPIPHTLQTDVIAQTRTQNCWRAVLSLTFTTRAF